MSPPGQVTEPQPLQQHDCVHCALCASGYTRSVPCKLLTHVRAQQNMGRLYHLRMTDVIVLHYAQDFGHALA